MTVIEISLPMELRAEAIRARDEHGNTDFYALLRTAADEIERLRAALDQIEQTNQAKNPSWNHSGT